MATRCPLQCPGCRRELARVGPARLEQVGGHLEAEVYAAPIGSPDGCPRAVEVMRAIPGARWVPEGRPAGFVRLWLLVFLTAVAVGMLVVGAAHAAAAPPLCQVGRDSRGDFRRSGAVLREFVRSSPQGVCPSTGKRALPCPGHEAHHIVWLSCGGADSAENLVWLTVAQHDAVHATTACKAKCVAPPAGATP